MIAIRSALFAVAFYGWTALFAILGAPAFLLLPERQVVGLAQAWARGSLFLLRVLAGTSVEIRGHENIPRGGAIVASKHQSALETFAMLPDLPYPTMVTKRELRRIPLFGLYTAKAGMIHVDRGKGAPELRALAARGREEAGKGRQIVIFPEGTRRPPGAAAEYHPGVGLLYKALDVPVVPVAVNSGLYWPRRRFVRYPGKVVIEFLPPILPGLSSRSFLEKLQHVVESASDRLLVEASRADDPPPLPPEAKARLRKLREG